MGENGPINPAHVVREAVRTGPVVVVTSGVSMLPHLEGGRSVRIEQQPLRFGHVAAFVGGHGDVVVHRHVATVFGRSIFLGDNNRRFDAVVPAEDLLGRVVSVDDGPEPDRHRGFLVRKILRLLPREARAYVHRRRKG